jgi:putative transposase
MEQGNLYHIYNRGNNKQLIFFERKNYIHFLFLFKKYLSDYVDVYAYCLMPNHFHFLVKIKEHSQTTVVFQTTVVLNRLSPIEKAFRDFFIAYAKGINKAYNRTGALFQQKFKKKYIDDDAYFTTLIQYIHANPVTANLCMEYADWEFSSYNSIIKNSTTLIKRKEVIDWFGSVELFIKIHQERKLSLDAFKEFLFD